MTRPAILRLVDLTTSIDYGLTASAVEGEGPKFLRITDLQDDSVNWSKVPFCVCTGKDLERYALFDGDIVFARTGATTGKSYLICSPPFRSVFASYLIRVRPNNQINAPYLAHFFQSQNYWHQISNLTEGAAQPGVNASKLANLKVPVPKLEEQERISILLDKTSTIRKKRRESLKIADEFLRSVFLDMFGDPVRNPKGWKLVAMDDVICETRCGPFGSALKRDEYVESGIPVWGIDNVHQNLFIEKNSLFITDQKYSELTSYKVKEGDVLISRAGTVGRMCVARPKNSPSIIGTNLIKVSLNHQKMLPEYMTALFTFFSDRIGTMKANNKDNAYSFMKTGILKEIKIPLPSIEKQQLYLGVVKKTEEHKAKKNDQLLLCDNFYNALSQFFFSISLGK